MFFNRWSLFDRRQSWRYAISTAFDFDTAPKLLARSVIVEKVVAFFSRVIVVIQTLQRDFGFAEARIGALVVGALLASGLTFPTLFRGVVVDDRGDGLRVVGHDKIIMRRRRKRWEAQPYKTHAYFNLTTKFNPLHSTPNQVLEHNSKNEN
jgi:hypothetical protein